MTPTTPWHFVLAAVLTSCGAPSKPARAPATDAAKVANPAPRETVVDRGSYTMSLRGQTIASERFEVVRGDSTRIVRSTVELDVMGKQATLSSELSVGDRWAPISARVVVKAGDKENTIVLARNNDALVQTVDGANEQRETRPSSLYIANNVSSHLAPLCALATPNEERRIVVFPGIDASLAPSQPFPSADGRTLTTTTFHLGAAMRLELVCDGEMLIAAREPMQGVLVTRVGHEAVAIALGANQREKPATPPDLVELDREVIVPAAGDVPEAKLSCSLMLPATHGAIRKRTAKKALPAVIMLTGSGGQDRDEDTVGPGGLKLAIFKVIAIELAKRNVASLRCDDRGVAKSTGASPSITLDTFVGDAKAMLAALGREAAVDPKRLGILGHSEGGTVAVALGSTVPNVRALALLAATGRPLDVVILEQLEWGMRQASSSDGAITDAATKKRALYDAIRDDKPIPADIDEDEKRAVAASAPWLRSHFKNDPATVAARSPKRLRVFIAQGEKDFQVKVTDAKLLEAAYRKAGARVTLQLYPDLNHLFSAGKTGGIADYAAPDARVDDKFLSDLTGALGAAL